MITNQCQFLGRLGGDISVKVFDSGDKIGNVSMAIDDSYKNKEGEKVERTVWANLVFRNRLVDIVEKYAPKGSKILVQGKYTPRTYEIEGEKRYAHEFFVNSMQLLDSKATSETKPQEQQQPAPPVNQEDRDDLPF